MTLSEEVRTQLSGYANEDRALWYLDDGSRIYRLNDGTASGLRSTVYRSSLMVLS